MGDWAASRPRFIGPFPGRPKPCHVSGRAGTVSCGPGQAMPCILESGSMPPMGLPHLEVLECDFLSVSQCIVSCVDPPLKKMMLIQRGVQGGGKGDL